MLAREPYDGAAAARLAALLLDRDADPDRALALAKRAVRFSRDAESYALLARAYERRGDAEEARKAAARASELAPAEGKALAAPAEVSSTGGS